LYLHKVFVSLCPFSPKCLSVYVSVLGNAGFLHISAGRLNLF
jgi:hypothetical protein